MMSFASENRSLIGPIRDMLQLTDEELVASYTRDHDSVRLPVYTLHNGQKLAQIAAVDGFRLHHIGEPEFIIRLPNDTLCLFPDPDVPIQIFGSDGNGYVEAGPRLKRYFGTPDHKQIVTCRGFVRIGSAVQEHRDDYIDMMEYVATFSNTLDTSKLYVTVADYPPCWRMFKKGFFVGNEKLNFAVDELQSSLCKIDWENTTLDLDQISLSEEQWNFVASIPLKCLRLHHMLIPREILQANEWQTLEPNHVDICESIALYEGPAIVNLKFTDTSLKSEHDVDKFLWKWSPLCHRLEMDRSSFDEATWARFWSQLEYRTTCALVALSRARICGDLLSEIDLDLISKDTWCIDVVDDNTDRPMVLARRRVPGETFTVQDHPKLPYHTHNFDDNVCANTAAAVAGGDLFRFPLLQERSVDVYHHFETGKAKSDKACAKPRMTLLALGAVLVCLSASSSACSRENLRSYLYLRFTIVSVSFKLLP
ncbi:hypothetical protein MPSEU_000824600 [Mayamaea pseudoterrestris]|nr:hypothetical protein MPSEU_000824600 [Mayamaea pseudoterrestris]